MDKNEVVKILEEELEVLKNWIKGTEKRLIVLVLIFCLICSGLFAQDIEVKTFDFGKISHSYSIYATDRVALIKGLKEQGINGNIFVSQGNITLKFKIDKIPHSPIYYKNGNWFIYYELNHGYMPIIRGNKK